MSSDLLRLSEPATERLSPSKHPIDALLDGQPTRRVRPGDAPRAIASAPSVAGYEIVEELGRGGMGVVYKAWQHSLKRSVALKMLIAGSFAGREDIERFRAEAMAVARLHHPHLLSIYEIGECQGLPFYAMEYMEGGSLSRRLNGRPIDPRVAAGLVRSLAEAIDYAHKNGIVHRDLKPANVLLTGKDDAPIDACNAKITDFGIAKNLHENTNYTRTGDILGTPHYMAPEQAIGLSGKVGPTADVYSLGAILYELLTGRAPFHGFEGAAVLLRLTREDPTPPSQLVRGLPDDLQTICLKCLEKDPDRRYASAASLADDLGRFLRSEPIQARPASLRDRVVKWTRRRPGWAAIIAMTFALCVFSFALMAMMWRQAVENSEKQGEMLQAWKALLADDYLERGIHLAEKGEVGRGMHMMLRALEVTEEIERAEKRPHSLGPAIRMNLASWGQLASTREKLLEHADWVWDAAFTQDRKYVVTASKDRKVKVWNTETGQLVGTLVHPQPVWAVAFHPDGKSLFTVCSEEKPRAGQLRAWSMEEKKAEVFTPRGEPMAFTSDVCALRLNAAGDRLWLSSYAAGEACLLEFDPQAAGNGLRRIAAFPGKHYDGTFAPDGATLATLAGTEDAPGKHVALWNGRTGASLGQPLEHSGPVRALTFSKTGQHLIVGSAVNADPDHAETSRLHVWDWATRKTVSESPALYGRIKTLALAPSGQMFAVSLFEYRRSVSDRKHLHIVDGYVALWQLHQEGTIDSYGRSLRTHNAVWTLAFSPDSRLLLAGSRGAGAFLWSVANCQQVLRPIWHEGNCVKVAFRGDGRQVVTASAGGNNHAAARLWEVPSFAHIGPPLPQPRDIRSVLWEKEGTHAWFGCGDFLCRWDPALGVKTEQLRVPRFAYFVHPTPDPRRFLFEFGAGDLHEYRCGSDRVELVSQCPANGPRDAQYHSHCRHDFVVQLWYSPSRIRVLAADGSPRTEVLMQPGHNVNAARLSKNAELLAVGESTPDQSAHRLCIYNVRDLTLVREVPLKTGVTSLDFSLDARTIAICGSDRQVQFFSVESGELERPPLFLDTIVRWIGFVGSNDLLLTSGEKGRILLWHVPTGKRVGPAFEHGVDLMSHAVHPQGKYLLTGTQGRMGMTWRIPEPTAGSIAHLRLWVESATGMEMKDRDVIVPIDPDQVLARRRQLAAGGAP